MERLSHKTNKAVDNGEWKSIQLKKGGPYLSHLFFIDDLILFTEANDDPVNMIQNSIQDWRIRVEDQLDKNLHVIFSEHLHVKS